MSPDDPRHGTEAGYSAHYRDGERACAACDQAKLRGDKKRRVLGPALQPLPPDVRRILSLYGDRTINQRSGVSPCAIHNLRKRGDKARAYPETIARLRRVRVPTDVGVVRRVRALTRLGWSAPAIAECAGIPYTTVVRLRDHQDRRWVGREDLRDLVARAYAEMSMAVPPLTRHSSRIANKAAAAGWPPPLAWDDIDDPDEHPHGIRVEGKRRNLLNEWEELRSMGESIEQAALRLGVTVGAIERAEFRRKAAA